LIKIALVPDDYPWKSIFKALLLLRTIVLYGSELSIDMAIDVCPMVYRLRDYNTALISRTKFGGIPGGTDYGAPVRQEVNILFPILSSDQNIRNARNEAKINAGENVLIPVGDYLGEKSSAVSHTHFSFGQGMNATAGVGAGFSLENIPGMYEGRPERYFDSSNDPRRRQEPESQYIGVQV